ncbi:MAG: glycosyl hydrolase family 28-related protein [Sphingomicrobium sp.]
MSQVGLFAAAVAVAVGGGTAAAAQPSPVTVAGLPVDKAAGRGAKMPFDEYEAENGRFVGTVVGPSRRFTEISSEASGRRAVRLQRIGDYVEITLAHPANAISVRAAIPDTPDGRGRKSALSVSANSRKLGTLAITSEYGWFYGAYPFSNRPSDGLPHHFFDESRLLLAEVLPAGTKVRIEVRAEAQAPWHVIDLMDFELVAPPAAMPAGAVSLTELGADPSGRKDSTPALKRAIRAAQNASGSVWIGPGTFRIDGHVIVDRVRIHGAGPWLSILRGRGAGFYGKPAPNGSTDVELRDFALIGEVRERKDHEQLSGIGGAFSRSIISNVWLQHHKVGIWLDGPLDALRISGVRIVDNTADGINLRRGATNSVIENVFVRNSGDDGIALWSHRQPDSNVVIRNNTVVAPILANGIAIYGGNGVQITGNLVADTVTQGGGIHLGNRFDAVPLSGSVSVRNNLLVRSGSYDPNWRFGVGAFWIYALDHPVTAEIQITELEIIDSTLPAILFIGQRITGVRFDGLKVKGAAQWLQARGGGTAIFQDVQASDLEHAGWLKCDGFAATFGRVSPELQGESNGRCVR